ncbi:MAG: CARDB domain-containing protein, partial [Promethearchaeota archaeon]
MASAVIIRGYSNDLLLVWDMDGDINNLIHEIKPDIFINNSDIVFSNEYPMEGDSIDVTATVYNIGDVRAKDISVYFYNGDPNNGGILIGTGLIDFLDYDAKKDITIPWVAQPGSNNIFVVVDYENFISEINEDNNIAMKSIDILPDLTLTSTDISFSNPNPMEDDDIFIKAKIYNLGGTKAENFRVTFFDNENVITTVEINLLNSKDFTEISVMWGAKPGIHNITVVIDPLYEILEWNETNNNASALIYVYPDIVIIDFSISNDIITYGEDVELSAEIQNIGATSANNIFLEFYDGNPYIDGILLDTKTVLSLKVDEKNSALFNWADPTPGIHKIFVIIDRQNMIDESDETNNLLYQELMVVNLPDLTIYEPEYIYTLDYIEINVPIENIGAGGATGVVIDLYDGDPLAGGELIVSKLITYIGPGQSEIASLKLPRIPKSDYLYIIIDPNNIIEESSEVNNQLIIYYSDIIKVDAGPDQQVEEGELVEFSAILYGGISGDFTFLWDFGDGSSGVGEIATHQYGDNGIYNVLLTVTGPNFLGTDELIVTVSNVAPIVDAGLDQTVNEDDVVSFTGTLSDPGTMDTHTIEWDFGDGTTLSGTLTPSHVYTDEGTYIVYLTITDDDGGVSTDDMIVIVNNVAPIADAGEDLISYDNESTLFDATNSWDTISDL